MLRGSPRAWGRYGINDRDLFIETFMKNGVKALYMLCEGGKVSPCWRLRLGSGQVWLEVGK